MRGTLEDFWSAPKLNAVEIARITEQGKHCVDDCLYLQVKPGGGRSWLHRYQLAGKARWSGLGSLKYVTLVEARRARDRERQLIRKGIDPVAERQRRRP